MSEFVCKTFSPEIFWTALSALGALGAVCVALFLPAYTNYKEYKNMKMLVYKEFYSNLKKIKDIKDFNEMITLPDGRVVSSADYNRGKFKILNLKLWNEYKFKIAIHKSGDFEDLERFNNYIQEIINLIKEENLNWYLIGVNHNFLVLSLKDSKYKKYIDKSKKDLS